MLKKIAKIGVTLGLLGLMFIPNVISKAVDRNILDKYHKWTTEQIACGYNATTGHTVLHLKDLKKIKVDKNGNKICIMLYPNYENASKNKTYSAVHSPKYNGNDMKKYGSSWNGNNGLIKAKINSGTTTDKTFDKYFEVIKKQVKPYFPFHTTICKKEFNIWDEDDFKDAMEWYFLDKDSVGVGSLKDQARISGAFAARTANSKKGSSINTAGIIKLTIDYESLKDSNYSYKKKREETRNSWDEHDKDERHWDTVKPYINPYAIVNGKRVELTPDDRKVTVCYDTKNDEGMDTTMDEIDDKGYTEDEIIDLKSKISMNFTTGDANFTIRASKVGVHKAYYQDDIITYTTTKTTSYPRVYGQVLRKTVNKKVKYYIKTKDPGYDNKWHEYHENKKLKLYNDESSAKDKMKSLVQSKSASHPTYSSKTRSSTQPNRYNVYYYTQYPSDVSVYGEELKVIKSDPSYTEEETGGIGDVNNVIKSWSTKKVATTDDGYLNNSVKTSGSSAKFTRKSNNCFSYTLTKNMGIDTEKLAENYNTSNVAVWTNTLGDKKTYYLMKNLKISDYKFTFGEAQSTYDYNDTRIFAIYDKNVGGLKKINKRVFGNNQDYQIGLGDYYNHAYNFSKGKVDGSPKSSEVSTFFGVASNLKKDDNHLSLKDGSNWKISFKVKGNKYTGVKYTNGKVYCSGNQEINKDEKQSVINANKSKWTTTSTITEIR